MQFTAVNLIIQNQCNQKLVVRRLLGHHVQPFLRMVFQARRFKESLTRCIDFWYFVNRIGLPCRSTLLHIPHCAWMEKLVWLMRFPTETREMPMYRQPFSLLHFSLFALSHAPCGEECFKRMHDQRSSSFTRSETSYQVSGTEYRATPLVHVTSSGNRWSSQLPTKR